MPKFTIVAAVLILTGVGVSMASATEPRVEAPATAERVDRSKIMINAPRLPTEEFTDYFGD